MPVFTRYLIIYGVENNFFFSFCFKIGKFRTYFCSILIWLTKSVTKIALKKKTTTQQQKYYFFHFIAVYAYNTRTYHINGNN